MVDWTTVLIGIGTSLIATGISGICKSIHQRLKVKRVCALLKKDIEGYYDGLAKKVTVSSNLVEKKSISVNFLMQIDSATFIL